MDGFEPKLEEVDLLVRELNTVKRPAPPKLTVSSPTTSKPAPPPVEMRAPVGRWTSDDLNISARPKAPSKDRLAFLSSIKMPHVNLPQMPALPKLPALPRVSELLDVRRLIRMPTNATIVRLWVGLGAAHSASMTFWPYEKGSPWGMVMYLLCLAMVLVTGVWGARLAWDQRLGAAHTIALGTVLWAVTLATQAVPSV